MQRAGDGQGFARSHVPGLRTANVDIRAKRHAFVGLDAAGGDGKRTATERVAGGPRVESEAVSDDRAANGDCAVGPGVVEDGLQFLVNPSESLAGCVVRPVATGAGGGVPGATGRPLPRVGGSGSRVIHACGVPRSGMIHRSGVIHGAGIGLGAHVIFDVAIGNEPVAVVAAAGTPAILDDPITSTGHVCIVLVSCDYHGMIDAAHRLAIIRFQVCDSLVQIVVGQDARQQRALQF